jgi:hypothetical protein
MKSKRQTTIAKREREKLVQERRDLKRQKKQAAAAAKLEAATNPNGLNGEPMSDGEFAPDDEGSGEQPE